MLSFKLDLNRHHSFWFSVTFMDMLSATFLTQAMVAVFSPVRLCRREATSEEILSRHDYLFPL